MTLGPSCCSRCFLVGFIGSSRHSEILWGRVTQPPWCRQGKASEILDSTKVATSYASPGCSPAFSPPPCPFLSQAGDQEASVATDEPQVMCEQEPDSAYALPSAPGVTHLSFPCGQRDLLTEKQQHESQGHYEPSEPPFPNLQSGRNQASPVVRVCVWMRRSCCYDLGSQQQGRPATEKPPPAPLSWDRRPEQRRMASAGGSHGRCAG